MDRVPGESFQRYLQSGTDEDVDRYARMGEFAVVAAFHDTRATTGWEMGDGGPIPEGGDLRAARRGERRVAVYLRKCDGQRHAVERTRKLQRIRRRVMSFTTTSPRGSEQQLSKCADVAAPPDLSITGALPGVRARDYSHLS